MKKIFYISLILLLSYACSKEKELVPTPDGTVNPWIEKYVGDYKVYDTTGVYLYDMNISHYVGISQSSNNELDSVLITNFADTFDLRFQFELNFYSQNFDQDYLNIGFHDSIIDYNNKAWWVGSMFYDTNSAIKENSLINDTLVLYFKQDNIKYYIQEAQPYYMCECKHVAVKQ